jgi:hypothetical protein
MLAAGCKPAPPPPDTTTVVQITSVPPGLKVIFDGQPLEGVTPLELGSVKAFDPHEVEVVMEGQPSWKKKFAPAAGVKTKLVAEFKTDTAPPAEPPAPTPAPAPAADAGPDAAPPPAADAHGATAEPTPTPAAAAAEPAEPGDAGPPGPDGGNTDPLHATWPVKGVEIDGKISALWVPEAGGVLVNLNPKKSYRVWTEGTASTRKGGPATANVRYFVEGPQIWQDETLGTLGLGARVIRGAKRMWIFEFDDDVSDNSGALRIYMQESKLVAPTKIAWDPKKKESVITPDPTKLFTLDGLNPGRTYTFAAETMNLYMRERPWGYLQQFVCRLDGHGPARFENYAMGSGSKTFSDVKSVTCFFMDANVEPNEGYMRMEFMNAP